MIQKFLLQQVNSCNAEHPPPSLQFVDGTIITHLSGFVNVLQESRPSMPAFCRFLLKPKSHSVQRCNRAACIGTMQFKGLGFPNKHFATQKVFLYRQKHCLLQQCVLSVRIQPILALVKHESYQEENHSNTNEPRDDFLLMELPESKRSYKQNTQ